MKRLPFAFALLLVGCQQQMAVSPGYRIDGASAFFADGRTNRPLVNGVVPRGFVNSENGERGNDETQLTNVSGMVALTAAGPFAAAGWAAAVHEPSNDLNAVDSFPFEITEQTLRHGRNRYMIYCAVCHDAEGRGRGMIVQRGYTPPPSYHIARLRSAPVGHFYKVITLGYGSMPSYRTQVPERDRWAIIAYVRALQLSQHFPASELSADMKRQRDEQGGPP